MDQSNKKSTVTIGIPAYNEEENIGFLLEEILTQNSGDFILEKVIVSSDGSQDDTVVIAEKMSGKLPMEVIDNKDRQGVAMRMNQIIENSSSDILVILNADVSIKDNHFIEKIIQPIVRGEAGLVSCKLEALEASNFFEKMLKANFEFKENFFGEYKQGKNIYTCHGPGRAFSKKIYQNLHFFKSVGEDAYSFLYCIRKGFSYAYVNNTSVFIRLPKNFSDHKKQSLRFVDSKKLFFKDFGEKFVQKQYYLPKKLLIEKLPGYFFKKPILAGAFLLQHFYLKIFSFFSKKQNKNVQFWEISASSKKLIDKNNKKSLLLKLSEQIFLRRIVYGFLSLFDNFFLAREKAVVLCYHGIGNSGSYFDVSLENFKKQVEWLLKEGYSFVSISEFLTWKEKGAKKMKKPMCVLTFDDGFKNILQIKKFLRERGVLPTIFVLSDKEHVSRKELGVNHDLLSWDEIIELKRLGWEIGSHGATHGDFEKMNEEELRAEIFGSKKALEEKLGFPVDYFAYPKGFYSKEIIRQVKDCGYRAAFSMNDGSADRCASNYVLPRIGINKTHLMSEFGMTFSSSVIVFRRLLKKLLINNNNNKYFLNNIEKKRRLDVVVKYFYPVAAGIEVNIAETYGVLVDEGWDVTIHTSKDILTKKNVLGDFELHRGLKIKRYRYGLLGYSPEIDWKNTDLVCLHNFNVVPHLFVMLRSLWMKILGKKFFSLVLTPHGGFNPEWSIFPQWIAIAKRAYHYTLGAWLINLSVDGVRAVSEWEKQEMVLHGLRPSKLHVISNGVEDAAFYEIEKEASEAVKEDVKKFGKYIIQIGRVYMIKNYETTLRALAILSPDINYVIVGPLADVEYKKSLEKLIRELGLEKRVFFTGVVRGVDKFYLIKHAQLMVHMALWESFCNVVHEGMSQGLVCIVADNTALPLLVKDGVNGYCLPTKNHELVAQKIQYVIDNQRTEEIEKMKQANYVFGRQHTWKMVSEKMGKLYTDLLHILGK